MLRTLAAQGLVLMGVFPLARMPWVSAWPGWCWVLVQGLAALGVARMLGLRGFWLPLQVAIPGALAWQAGARVPNWVYPSLLGAWALVFSGGVLTRVPLYNSNREAWQAVANWLPSEPGAAFIDLGAGLGGLLAFLARQRPDTDFEGVEASPGVWFVAWIRTFALRNCQVGLGSLWGRDLSRYQVVHAFLSPAPMARLWTKVCREMASGTLFLSHTFEVPGVAAEQVIPLRGRRDACLRVYRVP